MPFSHGSGIFNCNSKTAPQKHFIDIVNFAEIWESAREAGPSEEKNDLTSVLKLNITHPPFFYDVSKCSVWLNLSSSPCNRRKRGIKNCTINFINVFHSV